MSSAMPLALEVKGVPLWLDSSEGAPCWSLIITPNELAQKSLEPPWTFRVRDPRGDVRELGVRKERPDSSNEVVREATQILLDELSASNFDRMSDRIIAWTNKWSMRDGRTLMSIIRLVLKKAMDDAASCVVYARLCRKMMEEISSDVYVDGTCDAQGKLITGSQLFRNHLLDSCKGNFERYCLSLDAQATSTGEVKASSWAELDENELGCPGGACLSTQDTERRSRGTIRFIGELYKVQMLTERIMHMCVQKLLSNPEEKEIESLCRLLTTVGELFNIPRAHMDVYFARIKELTRKPTVSSRSQSMLQDLIELRARNWHARTQAAAPDSEHVGPDGEPGGVFAGKNANKRDSNSRQTSTSNMFHAVQSEGAEPVPAPESSRPANRKPSVDLPSATGIQPPAAQNWFYPPLYGEYVDPNWAAAHSQWYMPQRGPPPTRISVKQFFPRGQPMPMSSPNAPSPSQCKQGTSGPVYAHAAQTAVTSRPQSSIYYL